MLSVSHLFKKDLRRCQLLLAFWLLLVALQYLALAASLSFGTVSSSSVYAMIATVGPTLRAVVLVVLTAILIQEEPIAGTTGFWLTRPIPRSAVICTKTIFIALFVLCPLFAELVVLAVNGVTTRDLALAGAEILLNELTLVLLAVAFATVTPNFARFTVAATTAGVAWYLLAIATSWIGLRKEPPTVFDRASAYIESDALCLVGLTIAVLYQYRTRRTTRALVMISVTAVASVFVARLGIWNLFQKQSTARASVDVNPAALRIQLAYTDVQESRENDNTKAPAKNIAGQLLVEGLPEGYVALPIRARPKLTLQTGETVPSHPPKRTNYIYEPSGSLFNAAFGKVFVYGHRWTNRTVPSGLVSLDAVDFSRNVSKRLTFSDDIDFELAHLVIRNRAPLRKGAQLVEGSDRDVITSILHQGDDVEVLLKEHSMNLTLKPSSHLAPEGKYLFYPQGTEDGKIYVLFNSRKHEVIQTKMNGVQRGASFLDSRVIARNQSLSFGSDQSALVPRLNDEWLKDAELVTLELSGAAEFVARLEVKDFTLDGSNRPKTGIAEDSPRDPEWLTRFKLPENATRSEISTYVDEVTTAAQYWHEDNWNQLPIALLSKVGPGNADILLGEIDRVGEQSRESESLRLAILRSAGEEDKATILNALKTDVRYVDLVVKYHWEKDCSEILIQALKDPKKDRLPKSWISAVVSLNDPATFPDLKAYFLRAKNRKPTYNAMSKVTGLDLHSTADQVWAEVKDESDAAKVDAATAALDFGNLEALAAVVEVLRKRDLSQEKVLEDAASLLKRHLAAQGDEYALLTWYEANKTKLVFNPANRKYYSKDRLPSNTEEPSPM